MKFAINRDNLLQGLQFVSGVIERRQSIPILSNVLLRLQENRLFVTGTDNEIELTSNVEVLDPSSEGSTTLSGRKLIDICRQLPSNQILNFSMDAQSKASIQAGKSRFTLAILPAEDFPTMSQPEESLEVSIDRQDLKQLLGTTAFAMSEQDVRYYMNGLFFEFNTDSLTTVATDSHRMAYCQLPLKSCADKEAHFILPRKGVLELLRVLGDENSGMLNMNISKNAVKIADDKFVFLSRLIDGNFPNYRRVIPSQLDKIAVVDKLLLKQSLQKMLIFTSEKYPAARLFFKNNLLCFHSHNTENEEAVDEISLQYHGSETEIAFNIDYLLGALGVLPDGDIQIQFSQANNSVLIKSEKLPVAQSIIMPMTL